MSKNQNMLLAALRCIYQADRTSFLREVCKDAAQTIEQLTARVRELEEENARLRFALADTEALELGTSERLAASQLHAEQLRDAIEQYLAQNDPSEFGCACDLSVGHLCGPCFAHKQQTVLRKALTLPRDTSALDAYVSEKVKEIIESHAPEGRNVTNAQHVEMRHKFVEQIATLTRQRDLAVEALKSCGVNDGLKGPTQYFDEDLVERAIKESEQP